MSHGSKKKPKADLENKKNIFLEIGLMIAIGSVLLAFEWKVSASEPSSFLTVSEEPTEIEMVPITQMNQLPPPPPPSLPKAFELIEIVDELDPLIDELDIKDATDNTDNKDIPDINGLTYDQEDFGNEVIAFLPSEDMPVFPGNVQKWIAKNVKYPQAASDNGIEGKVYIQFIVERDGHVSNIKVIRGVDASIDKEAVRVIAEMPKWQPGKQRGKTVRVSYTLPISFQLSR